MTITSNTLITVFIKTSCQKLVYLDYCSNLWVLNEISRKHNSL